MKKALWVIIIAIVLAGLGFGIWGYLEANKIKRDGEDINQLTSNTLALDTVKIKDENLKIDEWEILSDEAPEILSKLQGYTLPDSFNDKLKDYYGNQAHDRYKEAQYLQFLNEFQGSLDLKSTQLKSKGQIETIAKYYDDLISQKNNFSLSPKFDSSRQKVEQESEAFRKDLNDIGINMSYETPPVRLRTADLDKAIDELKQEIAGSLNEWVDMQNEIKDEIANMIKVSWVMPL